MPATNRLDVVVPRDWTVSAGDPRAHRCVSSRCVSGDYDWHGGQRADFRNMQLLPQGTMKQPVPERTLPRRPPVASKAAIRQRDKSAAASTYGILMLRRDAAERMGTSHRGTHHQCAQADVCARFSQTTARYSATWPSAASLNKGMAPRPARGHGGPSPSTAKRPKRRYRHS